MQHTWLSICLMVCLLYREVQADKYDSCKTNEECGPHGECVDYQAAQGLGLPRPPSTDQPAKACRCDKSPYLRLGTADKRICKIPDTWCETNADCKNQGEVCCKYDVRDAFWPTDQLCTKSYCGGGIVLTALD